MKFNSSKGHSKPYLIQMQDIFFDCLLWRVNKKIFIRKKKKASTFSDSAHETLQGSNESTRVNVHTYNASPSSLLDDVWYCYGEDNYKQKGKYFWK